ncbi:hypothetical protein [Zhongshania borealis]|uniref:Uncharacterized protein n=1 Tax=Zhongshania borealis TaxID=889488 RepID=A0ABP7WVB4_9GAMM
MRFALEGTLLGNDVICDDFTVLEDNVIVGDSAALIAGGYITIANHVHVAARYGVTKSILEFCSYFSATGMMGAGVWRKCAL